MYVLHPLDICFLILANHVNLKALIDIQEVTVDICESLVVFLERLQKYRLGVEEPFWDYSVCHGLENETPSCCI